MSDLFDCLIAFGSNQGKSRQCFDQVCQKLSENRSLFELVASDLLVTPAIGGPENQNDYLNGCIRLKCALSANELFRRLCQIEKDLGRVRHQRWASRKIDLDLLVFGSQSLDCKKPPLVVPHPRMSFRRFVLQPALEIARDLVHPDSGLTIGKLVEYLDQAEPNIGLVTSAENSLVRSQSELRDLCAGRGYHFHHFIRMSASHLTWVGMKLLVYFDFDESSLVRLAKSFPGPTLRLTENRIEYVANEIKAAIEAMQPI